MTPESRIEMLEERSWLLERREETQEDRALAIALNHTYGRNCRVVVVGGGYGCKH